MKITDIDKIRNIIKDYLKYYDYYTPESTSRARATRSTAHAIPTATWTKMAYNTETYDERSEYDHTTNFRFTADNAGYYQVNANVLSASVSWTATQVWQIAIYKNGGIWCIGFRFFANANVTGYATSRVSDIVQLNADDYVEIFVFHTQGGSVNTHADPNFNYFSIHRLS